MFRLQALLVCALSVATASARDIFTYQFDPALAAGIQGAIKVKYVDEKSSKATISADLDFSKVDLSEIQKFDGNCTSEIVEYKWHIHVKWSSPNTSDKLAQCSKAATSNHYDPLKACGPNSEYAETPECLPKISSYACNPANYTKDPLTCEKGDLSGKFGGFKLDANKKASGEWTDEHYPLVSENTPQWNMILHAVCGKATPRIACAVAQKEADSCLS
ncbi:hypothetical protein Poli38472_012148 [Pythium oligandrum]|uniref:Uncharacterized protein n=1 Tax=Pythium oligandrum TaxID=41045 RepID=A0A8K1CQX6_PYTOL|nr:hypothetical protein Poli38472_012148 [Pythium oligandrum]|eukprot:TMW67032.1 hypothetical protein Poli38472_012148 [Pythium oligandrum]